MPKAQNLFSRTILIVVWLYCFILKNICFGFKSLWLSKFGILSPNLEFTKWPIFQSQSLRSVIQSLATVPLSTRSTSQNFSASEKIICLVVCLHFSEPTWIIVTTLNNIHEINYDPTRTWIKLDIKWILWLFCWEFFCLLTTANHTRAVKFNAVNGLAGKP